jgi:hypothetical protein
MRQCWCPFARTSACPLCDDCQWCDPGATECSLACIEDESKRGEILAKQIHYAVAENAPCFEGDA